VSADTISPNTAVPNDAALTPYVQVSGCGRVLANFGHIPFRFDPSMQKKVEKHDVTPRSGGKLPKVKVRSC